MVGDAGGETNEEPKFLLVEDYTCLILIDLRKTRRDENLEFSALESGQVQHVSLSADVNTPSVKESKVDFGCMDASYKLKGPLEN